MKNNDVASINDLFAVNAAAVGQSGGSHARIFWSDVTCSDALGPR